MASLDQAKELLQVEDIDVRFECLSNLCFDLATADNNRRYNPDEAVDVIKLMFDIFSNESSTDLLLELTARSLKYLIELCDQLVLTRIDICQYEHMVNHLEKIDLSTSSGREFAECLIKLIETISQLNVDVLYRAGASLVTLRFLSKYLNVENPFRDVINSTRAVLEQLFRFSEPSDPDIKYWMEILSELFSSGSDEVIKWTLQILGTILNRFLQTGQDLSLLPTGGLEENLSHNLFLICKKISDLPPDRESLFYNPSLFHLTKGKHNEVRNSEFRLDESDIPNIVTLLKSLLGLSFCSKQPIENMLKEENKIIFSISTILLHIDVDIVLALTFELLQVLVLRSNELNAVGQENFSEYLRDYLSFKTAISAIKNNDLGAIDSIWSSGFRLDYVDNQNQSILDWAAAYGNLEVVKKLIVKSNFSLEYALANAAIFGHKSICEFLLEAGASPYIPVKDGMNTLQLLEKTEIKGFSETINLLTRSKGSTELLNPKPRPLLRIYSEEVIHSKEGNNFILATELFFQIVDIFEKTHSETMKYQTFSFILKMVQGLDARTVEVLSDDDGAFRICHMIRMALSQECVKIVHLALQLCEEFLQKAKSIYLPMLDRHGIFTLMKTIDSMLTLPNFRFKSFDNNNYYNSEPRDTTSEYSDDNAWNSGDECNENDEEETEDNQPENPDGEQEVEENGDNHDGSDQNARPPEASPREYHRPSKIVTIPLGSALLESWMDWTVLVFGGVLFIFSDKAAVMVPVECKNKIALRAGYCTSMGKHFYCMENHRSIPKEYGPEFRAKLIYLIHKFREFGFETTNDLFRYWPYLDLNYHPLLTRRSRSQERKTARNKPVRRSASLPAWRTYESLGEEFQTLTVANYKKIEGEENYPVAIKAGDVMIDVIETPSSALFIRVYPDHKDAENALLFSACSTQGFYLALRSKDEEGLMNPESGSTGPFVRMDERSWEVKHLSGLLPKNFHCNQNTPQVDMERESQRIHTDLLELTKELTSIEANHVSQSPSSQTQIELTVKNNVAKVNELTEIKRLIGSASRETSKEKALVILTDAFTRLRVLFSDKSGKAVTHHELASSELVSAILCCLSSRKSLAWKNAVLSNKAEDYLLYLEARRNVFHEIFNGTTSLHNFVRCILDSLDQTECLPLHIFEQISRPDKIYNLTEALELDKDIALAPKKVSFDFTDAIMSEGCENRTTRTVPLGIIAPPLPHTTLFHNYLTGGGIRGLIDRRLLMLIGSWFTSLGGEQCSGLPSYRQTDRHLGLRVRRHPDSLEEVINGDELLLVSRGYRYDQCFNFLDNVECVSSYIKVLNEWQSRGRNSLPFLFKLMRGKKDKDGSRSCPEPLELPNGLIQWIGSYGGKRKWMNPSPSFLVRSVVVAAYCTNVISEPENAALELEDPADKQYGEAEDYARNDEVMEGYKVGVRWTIDTGVCIVPTAFQVCSIRRGSQRGPLIRHWCLQASVTGKRWMTLYISEEAVRADEPVRFPLNPDEYKMWSGPLSGNTNTMALARKLSHSSEALEYAAVCTPPMDEVEFEPPSFRVFRIMDLTYLDRSKKIHITGFDVFGTVKYVHRNLLYTYQILGPPSKKRPNKDAKHIRKRNGDANVNVDVAANDDDSSGDIFSEQDLAMFLLPEEEEELEIFYNALSSFPPTPYGTPRARSPEESVSFDEIFPIFDSETVEQSQGSGDTTNADASPTSPNSQDEDFSLEFASLFEAVAPTPPIQVQDSQAEVNAAQTEEPEGGEVREDGNKDDHVEPSVDTESEEKPAPKTKLTDAFMKDQVQRMLEGRELNRLPVPEEIVPANSIAPAMIHRYNPQGNNESAITAFTPRINPDKTGDDFGEYLEKAPTYEVEYELFARKKDGTPVSSIYIDDKKAPIFKYILRLAEQVLYSPDCEVELTADGYPNVTLSLEYCVRDSRSVKRTERSSTKYEENESTNSFFTPRDVRLVDGQCQLMEYLGVYLPTGDIIKRTEELLEIFSLLSKLFPQGGVNLTSFRINQKLERQLKDAYSIASGGLLPDWCFTLTQQITPLVPYATRFSLFRSCAFGRARSLLWMKETLPGGTAFDENTNHRNNEMTLAELGNASHLTASLTNLLSGQESSQGDGDSVQGGGGRGDFELAGGEFLFHKKNCSCRQSVDIGRLFKNYATVPRDTENDGSFYAWAERVLDEHAEYKPELEVRFEGEQGTGSGPTLEFYNLISLEFRRESLGMWISSYRHGEYVHHESGLFPAPYPRNAVPMEVIRRFYVMGITVGKALQDQHLLDLPLSIPFLKLLANYATSSQMVKITPNSSVSLEGTLKQVSSFEASRERSLLLEDALLVKSGEDGGTSRHWLTGALDFEDFAEIYPDKANFFREWLHYPESLSVDFFQALSLSMSHQLLNGEEVTLQDTYSWESSLEPSQETTSPIDITMDNFKDYIRRTLEFCLDKGIRAQMDAFIVGLERVVSMKWLSIFTSSELGNLIRGTADVSWKRQELLDYTEPVNNFSRDSPGYLLLIDVLSGMDAEDRREFLRFTTGSSCLPVGGLKNLQPRLKIARKSSQEGPLPTVNTCAHYLKIPEFKSAQELYEYLKISMSQIGFHLN